MARSAASFETPSLVECREGSEKAMENAERHLRCARVLAGAREYGPASSHLVLAGEEALKAEVLYSVSIGIPLSQDALRSVLRKHVDRHLVAGLAIGFSFLSRRIVATFSPPVSLPLPPLGPEQQRDWEEVLSHLRLGASVDEDRAFTKRCQDWWVCADTLRNSGFYADHMEGRWESPRSVSQEEYLASLEIVEAFFWSAKAFSPSILCCSFINPSRRASGRGGHPLT